VVTLSVTGALRRASSRFANRCSSEYKALNRASVAASPLLTTSTHEETVDPKLPPCIKKNAPSLLRWITQIDDGQPRGDAFLLGSELHTLACRNSDLSRSSANSILPGEVNSSCRRPGVCQALATLSSPVRTFWSLVHGWGRNGEY